MSGPKLATQKRVVDMTPVERREAREGERITLEMLAGPCRITAGTIRGWESGIEPRNRLAFECYLETLQELVDGAAHR